MSNTCICARIIDSQSSYAEDSVFSLSELRRLKNFIWRDHVLDETLRAMTIHREICPLILAVRRCLDSP